MKVKKMIAPVVITVIVILYFSFYIFGLDMMVEPFWVKTIGILTILALIGVSIFVLAERIKEIRSGEEDDLSKY